MVKQHAGLYRVTYHESGFLGAITDLLPVCTGSTGAAVCEMHSGRTLFKLKLKTGVWCDMKYCLQRSSIRRSSTARMPRMSSLPSQLTCFSLRWTASESQHLACRLMFGVAPVCLLSEYLSLSQPQSKLDQQERLK